MLLQKSHITSILIIVIVLFSALGGNSSFWAAFAICSFILVMRNASISGNMRTSYFILLFVHIGLLIYQITMHDLPMCGGDWGVYVRHAREIVRQANNITDILNVLNTRVVGDLYERLCAYIYFCFSYNQQFMYAVSFIAGEFVYYGIFKTALLITENPNHAVMASILFYITPLEMVYSVDFLREMVIQAFVINACFCLFVYLQNKDYLYLLFAVFLAIIVSFIHSGYVSLLLAFIACFFLIDRFQGKMNLSPIRLAIVFFIIMLIYISPAWSFLATRFSNITSLNDLAEASSTEYAGLGNTTYIGSPGNSIGVVLQTPLRFLYYLISPLPWQIKSFSTLIAMILDSTIRWIIFYRLIILIINKRRFGDLKAEQKLIFQSSIIIISVTTLFFSWGTSNYGTAMRHRTSLYPIEIIIAFVMWEETLNRKKTIENKQIYMSKYIK